LASSLSSRQQRLDAPDMMSTDEAAELVGASRVTVNAWITKGRAIGLTQTKRGFRMPSWQFEPLVWAALPKLSATLATTEGWALLSFLESPHGALNGLTPRLAIEQGQAARVIELAAQEGN
jgi:excisionase family DNA binding protein